MISAACKIEFIPSGKASRVLVDIGGWMDKLPKFTARQALFEPDGIHQKDGFIKPLGGVLADISFATIELPETPEEMWEGFLNLEPEVLTGVLVITSDERVTTFDPAVMTVTTPSLPGPGTDLVKQYQIQAALTDTEEA
ncbi:MAG TPA: hypothetical protein VGE67_11110 [Haloferula sp.]